MLITYFEDIVKVSLSETRFIVGQPFQKYELIARLLYDNDMISIDWFNIDRPIDIPESQVFLWEVSKFIPSRFQVFKSPNGNCLILGFNSNACYIDSNEFKAIGMMLYHFKSIKYEEEFL